jgi:hypothetical protein
LLGEGLLQFLYKNDAKQKKIMSTFGKDISIASTFFKTSHKKVLENCILTEPHWGHYNAKGYSLITQIMLREISMQAPAK